MRRVIEISGLLIAIAIIGGLAWLSLTTTNPEPGLVIAEDQIADLEPVPAPAPEVPAIARLGDVPLCSVDRAAETCVVDGDTIRFDGWKIRVWGIDAPEMGHRAECEFERALAVEATVFLAGLMSGRYVTVNPSHADAKPDDYGNFGRRLSRIELRDEADGEITDAGERLIAEGLAVEWAGSGHDWCEGQLAGEPAEVKG